MNDSSSKNSMFLFGNSPVGELAKNIDWSKHPLGEVSSWSRELKTAISIMMGSKFPMFISWGPKRYFFYNDSYAVILGNKHPKAFGDEFYNIWFEIWPDIEPLILTVDRGEAVYLENLKLIINRSGIEEEGHFTFSYSPLLSETGNVEGLYCAVVETTLQIKAGNSLKSQQLKLETMLVHAPFPIAMLKGHEHCFIFANAEYRKYFLQGNDPSGKTVAEVLPTAGSQGFIDILDKVYQTGERFVGNDLLYVVSGPDETKRDYYFTFVYEPIRDSSGKVEGILAAISDVTSLVESRRKVEESESRLAFALEGARMGIWSVDLITKKAILSEASQKLLGVKGEYDSADQAISTYIHPDDREHVSRTYKAAVSDRTQFSDEYRIVRPDGEIRWIQSRGHPRTNEYGEYVDMIGTMMDITEEKNAHNIIKASEARLKTLIETIPQMAWRADHNGTPTYFNHNWLKKTGTSLEESLENWLNVVHPDDQAKAVQNWHLAVKGSVEYNSEYRVRMANGTYRWHVSRAAPIVDKNGGISEWIGTTTDIDDQKNARIQYERSVDGSPSILWITGRDGSCSYLSKRWFEFTGQTEEEALGFGWLDATHPDDKERTAEIYHKANSSQKPFNAEYRLRTKSGDYRWAIDAGNPRYDEEGNFLGYAGTVFDIHDLKLFEAELREAVRTRDDFLSIASHELKTPLTSLKLQTQIRDRIITKGDISYFDKDRLKKMFSSDSRQIDRLARLIDDMLDISRINTGKLGLQPETFDLCALVNDVLERYSVQILEYGEEVTSSCSDEVKGIWDKFRIEQVVINLLTNALRYGNNRPIKVIVRKDEEFASLEVIDQGRGIAKEHQSRIFERFERAVTATEISGLGLGLFIVKQIIDMHKGSIEVESELGKGTTFKVKLPLEQGY